MIRTINNLWVLVLSLSCFVATAQKRQSDKLEPIAEFGKHMGLGVSVNTDNRVYVSFPNYDGRGKFALTVLKDGKPREYPDKKWNKKPENEKDYKRHFLRIQDIYIDNRDRLWVLDSKPTASGNIFGDSQGEKTGQFKLVKINTKNDKVEKVYTFKGLDKKKSALNDVRVDNEKGLAYLSDPGLAAIVVLDLKTGKTRSLLEKNPYTLADDYPLRYHGKKMVDKRETPFSSDINGIALTHDMKYFYFKPINKQDLFRIKTKYLADTSLSEETLAEKVETVKDVGNTHGLLADKHGNVYLTTSESYSIKYVDKEGHVHTLVKDFRLIWPDSMGIGTDGYLYLSATQIQRLPQWNNGEDKTDYPYRVFRVKLPR